MDMAKLAALSQHFASLTGLYLEKPRMPQPIQEYTWRYWPTHISMIFNREWKAKCEKLKAEGKEVPTKIGVEDRNAVVRRLWQNESRDFQDTIKADVEQLHKEKMREYKEKMKNIPQLGKQYTWYVVVLTSIISESLPSIRRSHQHAFALLQPLAAALQMRFGAVVSIMIAAPIQDNGEVGAVQ